MATQEIGLNEALEAEGIAAWETDLAELIVQLGDDLPSHILVPAIHRNRAEIREIFRRRMADVGRPAPDDLTDEPAVLAAAARAHLREKFLRAKVGVSRRQLRRRRDRHPRRRRVRGQRPDVPDPARGARQRGRHREGRADLARPRRVPAAAAALVDRRADEPLHLDLDRGHARRRTAGGARRPARQRPHPRARRRGRAGRRCAASAARPASTSARSTSGSAGTPTARSTPARSARSSTRCSAASADEQTDSLPYASSLCGACFEVCPVRDRHPLGAGRPARAGRRRHRGAPCPKPEAVAMKAAAWTFSDARRLGCAERRSGLAGRVLGRLRSYDAPGRSPGGRPAARSRGRLDRRPRPARPAGGVVPRLVEAHATEDGR